MPCGLTTFFSITGSARNRSLIKGELYIHQVDFLSLQSLSSLSFASCFSSSFYLFFPVFIAVLQHTFPSRTRLLRGPATMILYVRVWESSSTPDFFCPLLSCPLRQITPPHSDRKHFPWNYTEYVVAGHNQTINMIEFQNKELKNAWDALNYFWVPEIL